MTCRESPRGAPRLRARCFILANEKSSISFVHHRVIRLVTICNRTAYLGLGNSPLFSYTKRTMNDTQDIIKQILKAIRGKRSQLALSRKLGFNYNQVYRWEKGLVRISWKEFVALCRGCKARVDEAFSATYLNMSDAEDSASLVAALIGDHKLRDVAERSGYSRFLLSRWRAGKTTPSLEQVLDLWQIFDGRLIDFFSHLGIINELPSLNQMRQRQAAFNKLLNEFPYTGMILWILEAKAAKLALPQAAAMTAKALRVTTAEVSELLERLLSIGIIKVHKGHYSIVPSQISTLSLDSSTAKNIRRFWLQRALVALESYKTPPQKGDPLFGYLEFNVNRQQLELIHNKYFDFYQEILNIVQQDKTGARETRVLSLQLFDPLL